MADNLLELAPEFWLALGQTFAMVGISVGAAFLFGTPLGVLLFLTDRGQILEQITLHRAINYLVNTVRSLPFVILLVAIIPLTRVIVGTTIGPIAASVPLSLAAIPFFARLVEQSLRELPKGVIEAAVAMGASPVQLVWKMLLNEARGSIVSALTVTSISLLSYSAMAGTVGGGGIGDLAIRFGYYRFQTEVMAATVVLLILLVQLIQFAGNRIAQRLDKK